MTEIKQLITVENSHLQDIKIDQTVICDGKFYSQIDPNFMIKPEPKLLDELCQYPHIFYPFTEDIDYATMLSKIKQLKHKRNNDKCIDKYTDDDAETQYLLNEPISYIILGKPEIGQVEIAKMLSDTWKCININPLKLVSDELKSESRAGRCIAYNLEAGRAVEPEIILRLVEKRVKSQTVQHRGAIINGFPLIANSNYNEDIISSESAIFNVQDIFEELIPADLFARQTSVTSIARQVSQVDEENTASDLDEPKGSVVDEKFDEVQEETAEETIKQIIEEKKDSDIDIGPSDIKIVIKSDKYNNLGCPKKQLEFIFKLFENKPLIIIYIICDNIDVIRKRQNYRFHVSKQIECLIDPIKFEIISDDINSRRKSYDFNDLNVFNIEIDGTQMKEIVKLPHHFKTPISSQLIQYRRIAKPVIDNKVLNSKNEFFIKCDGRLSNVRMFNSIDTRLQTLGLQNVLIPEKVKQYEQEEIDRESAIGEEVETLLIDVFDNKLEESFKYLRVNKQCGSMYKFGLSNWRFKCPVSLKEGRIVTGKSEFAVKFMSKLYFLSDEDALLKFCKNPRPFLLPTLPNPTCRIWIFGPMLSGKSAVAKCLSYLFNCKILNLHELERKAVNAKVTEYIEKLRTAAITEALVTINNNRKIERQETIDEWIREARSLLQEVLEFNVPPTIPEVVENIGESDFADPIDNFNFKLKSLNLPSYSENKIFKTLIASDNELMKHLPEIFSRPIEPATVFDQFVKNYVKTAINSAILPDMTLTFDEKVDMVKNAIQETEDEYYQIHKTRGGWIIDGMFTDSDFLDKLCPEYLADDIICLKDTDIEHKFLMGNFLNKDQSLTSDLSTFFGMIKRYSLAEITKDISNRNHSRLNVISSAMDEIQEHYASKSSISSENETNYVTESDNYFKSLNEFNQKWNFIKVYLTNIHKVSIIEINLENKSIQELLKNVVNSIENKYRILAHIMSTEDIKEEIADYGGKLVETEDESVIDDEEEGVNPAQKQSKFYQKNRRLGNTDVYCPVVFDRHFVLWKGSDLYQAYFAQCVYYLSSENALKEFVADPRIFLNREPPEKIPPPRICIIGTTGSGKTSCAKILADNYGLHYVNFDYLVLQAFDLPLENLNYIIAVNPVIDDDMQLNLDKLHKIKEYLERDSPLNKSLIKQILTPLWFQEPYVNVGFVLDNFPRRPSDVLCMTEYFFIPDIVIELSVNIELALNRKYPLFFTKRKREIAKYNQIMREEYEMKCSKWQEDRYLRLQHLLEERWERFQKKHQMNTSTQKLTTPIDSEQNLINQTEEGLEAAEGREVAVETEENYVEYDEYQQKLDLDESNAILDKEMPMPVFIIHLPTEQEISDSINNLIEEDYWRDLNFLEFIKQNCHDFNITYESLKTSRKTAEHVFYEVLRLTDTCRFRNKSFLERVYEIDIHTADSLLSQGYYFMSRFGRTCPVQRYENKNLIQMFLHHQYTNIFPLIYRRYIYFVYSEANRDKFMNDPLKYITANTTRYYPMIPAKIAIIGPPKAGKSTLAKRLEREYYFKIITRGNALRYVIKNFPQSYLTENIKNVIEPGWSVTYEMCAKAVEALTLDPRSITQGYVLDGFPQTEEEMKQLIVLGIVPYVIIDIRVTKSMIYQNLATIHTPEPFRTYSVKFIDNLYYRWERNAYDFRQWLYNNYQNVKSIENEKCKWHLCEQAKPHIMSAMFQLHEYLYKNNFENVISLTTLCITPEEFTQRQSEFRMFCPLCWFYLNILNDAAPFPDRRNVFQYLCFYYYICDKHRFNFFLNPDKYISLKGVKPLPVNLPVFIKHRKRNKYHEDGLCITCYWDNQPKRILKKGSNKFVISYRGVNYRFCSEECAKAFFREPDKYSNVIVHFRDENKLDLCALNKLPTLGYLEQLAGELVIDAVMNTEIERPYLAGLSIAQSAALHMGMYLKMNNPNTSKESLQLYKEAKEKYDHRRDILKKKLEHFKNRINPFVSVNKMRTERYKYGPRYMDDDDDIYSEFSKQDLGTSYTDTYQHATYSFEGYEFEYGEA